MKKQAFHFLVICITVLFVMGGCKEKKFEKRGWTAKSDAGLPPEDREKMISHLLSTYELVGMKSRDILLLLGEPDGFNSSSLSYKIQIDYGFDIDQVYTKDLYLFIAKDSVVSSYEVREWKKD